jgi:ABC-type multidrug transport system fused ATPase/permease subunit
MVTQHVQQGIGGAKAVIIRGCEREFLERFRHHTDASARIAVLQSLMSRVPRLWFEMLAVAALLLLTAVLVWQDASSERVLPMLGLFAMVAFRMLLSVNNLTDLGIRLRSAESMLDHLVNELMLAHDTLGARHGRIVQSGTYTDVVPASVR